MKAVDGGSRRLKDAGTGLEALAVQLQDVTNRSRLVIRRTEKKLLQNRGKEPGDVHLLSAARIHSLLQSFCDLHDTASSVAESLYRFTTHLRYLEDLSGLSVFAMNNLLLRERVNMVLIHRNNTEAELLNRICSGTVMQSEQWYEGWGWKRYSHLSAFRAVGEFHSRYYAAVRRIAVNFKNMMPVELAAEQTGLERTCEQLTGAIGELLRHVEKLMEADWQAAGNPTPN
ncbi:TPA: hypothetical protein RU610_004742 [Salmonella enterica]|nr:hypothetical protein [Salmonella enterica]HEA0268723.1 hypothetical protein [Salmonella enterica]HEA0337035.1 hypothetical protein [Salmonella enterica]HEA0341251.1 hypothetical protein [Salmonella enterica]HEA0384315.1 hypothetical protein [Salmonella enterica]